MATRVVMPKLTDTMEEGVVLKWKKHEGESVAAGDVLAEIETDKAVMDLEAFGSGTLRKVLVDEGATVASGSLIAVIAEPSEDIAEAMSDGISASKFQKPGSPAPQAEPPKATAAPPAPPQPAPQPAPPPAPTPARQDKTQDIKASPRAKTLARERGIALESIRGSGPGGRITEKDVLQAVPSVPTRKPVGGDKPLSQMRKAIARTTTQSKALVPHFYVTSDIDMSEADRFRRQFNHTQADHLSLTDMIVKSASLALTRRPEVNVSYVGDALRQHATVNIGIAVGLEDGLITPVVRDCGSKTLLDISKEVKVLADRARKRQLAPEEYTDATFSISNLGMYDVDSFIAVLTPPEAAVLAVGSIRDVPIVRESRVRLGRRMRVTLSCDHRALDGVQGAKFLQEFKRILEHPLELLLADTEGTRR